MQTIPPTIPAPGSSVPPIPAPGSGVPTLKADDQDVRPLSAQLSKSDRVAELVALFNIPLGLMECLATLSLRFAFQKFQACKSLQEQIQTRIADGTWVGKSPSKDEVIEIFISKSV